MARVATDADLDGVTTTLSKAFLGDPIWSWVFPGGKGLEVLWRLYVESALRYPWVWTRDDYAAAATWIPPGGTELTEEEEARFEPLLRELIGSRASEVVELVERFESAHPRAVPHYYLSLLGTHPDRRGEGLGMGLLAETLAAIDAERMPAYLESTNPDNDKRYERLGFVRNGEFTTPDGSHTVTTMWRPSGP